MLLWSQKPKPSRVNLLLASKVPMRGPQRLLRYQISGVAAALRSAASAPHRAVRIREHVRAEIRPLLHSLSGVLSLGSMPGERGMFFFPKAVSRTLHQPKAGTSF